MAERKRPRITLNYILTADGKLSTTDRAWSGFGSHRDRDRMDRLRAESDCVLIGAETVRREQPDLRVSDPARRRARLERGRDEQPRIAVLSRSLDLPLDGPFFSRTDRPPLVLTPADADADRLADVRQHGEVVAVGDEVLDLDAILQSLWDLGIERLLVEGGGQTNALFVEAGQVDEIYLTLAPFVAGGATAPTPVDGAGLRVGRVGRLELVESYQGGEEIFCRYRVVRDGD